MGATMATRGPAPMTVGTRLRAVVAFYAVVYRRVWRGSVIGRFLNPLLVVLSIGFGLGSLVDHSSGGVGGHDYLHFVVPAIIATQAMSVALGESTYQVMGYIMWNKMYLAMLATPLSVTDVLAGHLLAVALHLVFASVLFVGVAACLGAFTSWWVILAVPAAVLTGLAFAIPIFGYTARLETDTGFNVLFRFVVTPLMLFSGTFFPVDQLSPFLRPIAWVTPLWHGVELCRDAAYGQVHGADLVHAGALLLFIGLGWVWARWSFTRRLVV